MFSIIADYFQRKIIKGKIKNKLVLYSICLFIFNLLVIGMTSSKMSTTTIIDRISETNVKTLEQCMGNTDFVLKSIENTALSIFDNINLARYIDEYSSGDIKLIYENDEVVTRQIRKLMYIKDDIEFLYILGYNGAFFTNENGNLLSKQDIEKLKEKAGQSTVNYIWTYISENELSADRNKRLALCKSIEDRQGNFKGVIVILLKEGILNDIYRNLNNSGKLIMLVDKYERIVSCSDVKMLNPGFLYFGRKDLNADSVVGTVNNQKYLVSYLSSEYSSMKLYLIEKYSNIISGTQKVKFWIYVASINCIILFFAVTFIFGSIVIRPMNRLLDSLKDINSLNSEYMTFRHNGKVREKIKKFTSKLSLKMKLSLMLNSTVIILTVMLITVSYSATSDVVRSKAAEAGEMNTKQTRKRIEYYLKNIEKSIYNFYYEKEFVEMLKNIAEDGIPVDSNCYSLSESVLRGIQKQNRNILYTSLYTMDKKLLYSTEYGKQMVSEQMFNRVREDISGLRLWIDTYKDGYNDNIITFGKTLKDTKLCNLNIGYIFASITETDLEYIYRDTSNNGDFSFITNNEGVAISHNNKEFIGKTINRSYIKSILKSKTGSFIWNNGNEDFLISFDTIENTSWKIVNVSSLKELRDNLNKILLLDLLLLVFSICLALYIVGRITDRISKPVKELTGKVKNFENNEFVDEKKIVSGDEIEELSISFEKLMMRIKNLIDEVYIEKIQKNEAELQKKVAELSLLQAQINPHFLYNTLDIIRWKSMFLTSGENEVTDMVEALSDFFRISLSKGKKVVPIKDEIEHVRNYVKVMNYRYKNKITVRLEVQEDIKEFLIPGITLQPIVENAINHGLKPKGDDGVITIAGMLSDGIVCLSVADNGAGMDSDGLKKLKEIINGEREQNKGGFGLKNVNERIKLYFGDNSGLEVFSSEGKGTTVRLRFPVQKNEL